MRKNKGITLVALIVTIIILIILAGISITLIAGSEGLMSKTSQALDQNDEATATEKMELKITYFDMISYGENTRKATLQELAEGLFQDKEIDYIKIKENKIASLEEINVTGENSIFAKLKKYPYEFEIDNDLHVVSTDERKNEKPVENTMAGKDDDSKNRTLSGETNGYSYKNPVIPQGFFAVDEGDAIWKYTDRETVEGWNNGLVIQDDVGNQFVWIPIDGTTVTYELISYSDFKTEDDSDAYPAGVEDEAKQIAIYEGFYVARFEAGIETATNTHTPKTNNKYNIKETGLPVSKKGAKIWNYITYSNAKKVSKAMINDAKYGENKSGLITGRQWDSIMKWFEESGIGVRSVETTNSKGETVPAQNWGSYNFLEYKIEPGKFSTDKLSYERASWQECFEEKLHVAGKNMIHASGLNPSGIKKNIADLGGNVGELTALVENSTSAQSHAESGYPNTQEACALFHKLGSWVTRNTLGFRVVLYVKVNE